MRESFETRNLTGPIAVKMKDPANPVDGLDTDERSFVEIRAEKKRQHGEWVLTGKYFRYWVADKADIVKKMDAVIKDFFHQRGFKLTLRQLYYQLVGKDYIPNHDAVYKKLSGILDDCRYSGLVDWKAIEDRGRVPHLDYYVRDVPDALDDTINHYKLDRQRDQDFHIEIWTEKDAISAILKRITQKFHVYLAVNKGYTSSSAIYSAYNRFVQAMLNGKRVIVLYFGDHDPSGLDMVRDIDDRIRKMTLNGRNMGPIMQSELYSTWGDSEDFDLKYENEDEWWAYRKFDFEDEEESFVFNHDRAFLDWAFEVRQVGLSMEQIKELKLPPNPAKITDPRAKGYIEKYGNVSWEVDALDPEALMEIISAAVVDIIDMDKYEVITGQEEVDKKDLKVMVDKYNK